MPTHMPEDGYFQKVVYVGGYIGHMLSSLSGVYYRVDRRGFSNLNCMLGCEGWKIQVQKNGMQ